MLVNGYKEREKGVDLKMHIVSFCIKTSVLFFITIIMVYICTVRYSFFCSAKPYSCTAPLLSSQYRTVLENELEKVLPCYSCFDLIAHLQQQFPVINHVSVSYLPHMVALCITPHTPVCVVNDTIVLDENGVPYHDAVFSHQTMSHLPHISVTLDIFDSLAPSIPPFLSLFPAEYKHGCAWHFASKHAVYITDTGDQSFTIKCCIDQQISADLLHHCYAIKKELLHHNTCSKKRGWIADIRFARHIIVYTETEQTG